MASGGSYESVAATKGRVVLSSPLRLPPQDGGNLRRAVAWAMFEFVQLGNRWSINILHNFFAELKLCRVYTYRELDVALR